jgi:hypothetical protein
MAAHHETAGSQHSDDFSKTEKGLNAVHAENGTEEEIPWTFTRVIAIISLCLVYVGSQVILYFISAGLTVISKDLNTEIGNWMVTANVSKQSSIFSFWCSVEVLIT